MYVIASQPYPNTEFLPTPAILFRVEDGRLEKVRTITTYRQDTLFVHSYPDKGYVFVGSVGARNGAFLLDVLDLRTLRLERTLELDGCWGCNASNHREGCMGCRYATSHLLNRDGRQIYMIRTGTWYSEQLDCSCRDLGVDVVSGETIEGLSTGALRLAYHYGAPGGLIDGGEFGAGVYAEGARAVAREEGDSKGHYLGWSLPPNLKLGSGTWRSSAQLFVNNDYVRVLAPVPRGALGDGSPSKMFFVFDKAAGEWSELLLPGSGVFRAASGHYVSNLDGSGIYYPMRAFREWLAAEEIRAYEPSPRDRRRLDEIRFGAAPRGPFLLPLERFNERRSVPTGRLLLHNAQTRENVTYDTDEPDSEVLYVDGSSVVYFRVGDELRRARIEEGGLGKLEIVVKAPEVAAVHWLFFGRE